MLLECAEDIDLGVKVGDTVPEWVLEYEGERIDLTAMQEIYEGKLDKVFSYRGHTGETTEKFSYSAETYPVPAVKTKSRWRSSRFSPARTASTTPRGRSSARAARRKSSSSTT